jgi:hypothetical protein
MNESRTSPGPAGAPALLCLLGAAVCAPAALRAQSADPAGPVIDTVMVATGDVFSPQEADGSFVFGLVNLLHIHTRPGVVRGELLLRSGEAFDSARAAETERNLRSRDLFRSVLVDTARLGRRFAVLVHTQDGWTTRPRFKMGASSNGTVTGAFGITEGNFLGTGTYVRAGYRRDIDHSGLELELRSRRLPGTRLAAGVSYFSWSDGQEGDWELGLPFFAMADRHALVWSGEAADQRVLQFRVDQPAPPDTTVYQRRALVNRLTGAYAPIATPKYYLRLGLSAELRREEFLLQRDAGLAIPDTASGTIGGFVEFRRVRFRKVRYYNEFNYEDIDLSTTVRVGAQLAPTGLGHERTGIGPRVELSTAVPMHGGFVRAAVSAGGLFTGAGLDSATVLGSLTVGASLAPRHASILNIAAGLQQSPRPGNQFDLGFDLPPRAWQPHSFVGTRTISGTFEQRWFALDGIFRLIDLGFAGFVDVAGAWYRDQTPRFGGDVGIGLRMGGALSAAGRVGRFDLGYRFGDDLIGSRWVLSVGHSFVF